MHYRVNPPDREELRLLARERLAAPSSDGTAALSANEVQQLLEDLEIHRIELEIQNEYLQETYARLKLALDRAQDLYDFAPVACLSVNAQGLISASNIAGSNILGVERSNLLHRPLVEFFTEGKRPDIHSLMVRAMQSGENQRCDLTLLHPHTACTHVQLDLSALAQGDGCQVVLTDTTANKTTEQQLRQQIERCEFALGAAGDCLWEWDLRNGTMNYSRQLTQLYGYSAEEMGNSLQTWRMLIHTDSQAGFIQSVQQCLSGKEDRCACELRVLCKDGSYKWILCRAAVFSREPDGRANRMVGTHTDITPYK